LAYPNHRNRLLSEVGMLDESLRNGLTSASTKNGNQHTVNALIMMPNVVDAFRSLANWNRSFLPPDSGFLVAVDADGFPEL